MLRIATIVIVTIAIVLSGCNQSPQPAQPVIVSQPAQCDHSDCVSKADFDEYRKLMLEAWQAQQSLNVARQEWIAEKEQWSATVESRFTSVKDILTQTAEILQAIMSAQSVQRDRRA